MSPYTSVPCPDVVTSGPRKGLNCGKMTPAGEMFCMAHLKQRAKIASQPRLEATLEDELMPGG